MANKKRNKPSFEEALSTLEELVERMESGDLPLEDSIREFEKGMQLSAQCQRMLEEAEQRIQILSGKNQLKDYQKDPNES